MKNKFHPTTEELERGRVDVFISKSTVKSAEVVERHYQALSRRRALQNSDKTGDKN